MKKNKYRAWLEVEILADEAWAELGEIPKEDVALIREKADFDIDRILEIEQETRHDVVASRVRFLRLLVKSASGSTMA